MAIPLGRGVLKEAGGAGTTLRLRVRSGDANALPEPGSVTGTPPLIPMRELVHIEESTIEKSLYHKNLMPVTYVIGDVAGVVESSVYAIFAM
ncbi:MAG: hypothetical protein WA376_13125, partial [Terrimicrobiaceae bacterium]